jgi:ion channel-forming bestrophin family protein
MLDLNAAITRPIIGRSLVVTAWSIVVHVLQRRGYVGGIGASMHMLLGVSFGLLLVFRTNTSYDRYWEGRRLWGVIIEESRHLARLASLYVPIAQRRECLACLAVAVHSTLANLRGQKDCGPHVESLPPEVRRSVLTAFHAPTAALTHAGRIFRDAVRSGHAPATVLPVVEEPMRSVILSAGGCNRIRTTPIPFAYRVHLRRSLVLYAFTLPFALAGDYDWLTIPSTFALTFILFGIEEIGSSIEDPFGFDPNDLPLEVFQGIIESTIFDPELAAIEAHAPAV